MENKIKELRTHLIAELSNYNGKPVKLDLSQEVLEEIIFNHNHDGSKEFAITEIISKIDFTNISFKNFKCNIDFSNITGVTINPQEVFEKKLTNANLEGVTLDIDTNGFDDVYIEDTKFKGAKTTDGSPITINPQTLRYRQMRFCVFDGVVFIGEFCGTTISGSDFRGSIGAIINPQTILDKDLSYTKFGGVKFINNFNDVKINNSDFTGSKGAVINPQLIYNKSLMGTILKNAKIIGKNMDGVIVIGTDFTDSEGEIWINPQTLAKRDLSAAKLFGVRIIGPIDGCCIAGANFTGSINEPEASYMPVNKTDTYDIEKIKKLITDSIKK